MKAPISPTTRNHEQAKKPGRVMLEKQMGVECCCDVVTGAVWRKWRRRAKKGGGLGILYRLRRSVQSGLRHCLALLPPVTKPPFSTTALVRNGSTRCQIPLEPQRHCADSDWAGQSIGLGSSRWSFSWRISVGWCIWGWDHRLAFVFLLRVALLLLPVGVDLLRRGD